MKKDIIKNYMPINTFSRPNIKLKKVKGLVIHYTADQYASAKGIRDYFTGLSNQNPDDDITDRYAGTQFVVDWNEIIQMMDENERAYHVGAWKYIEGITEKIGNYPNDYLIGIEVCYRTNNAKFEEDTISNLIWLCKYLMNKYKLTINDVYRHYDITGKNCPLYYVKHEESWIELKEKMEVNL